MASRASSYTTKDGKLGNPITSKNMKNAGQRNIVDIVNVVTTTILTFDLIGKEIIGTTVPIRVIMTNFA